MLPPSGPVFASQGFEQRGPKRGSLTCGWTKSISHEMKPWLKPLFVGIYRGIIIPGFLGRCRISSIHSRSDNYALEEVARVDCAIFQERPRTL